MSPEDYATRHRDRCARIFRREVSLSEAHRENDVDWQALRRYCVEHGIAPPWYPTAARVA